MDLPPALERAVKEEGDSDGSGFAVAVAAAVGEFEEEPEVWSTAATTAPPASPAATATPARTMPDPRRDGEAGGASRCAAGSKGSVCMAPVLAADLKRS